MPKCDFLRAPLDGYFLKIFKDLLQFSPRQGKNMNNVSE